MANKVSKFVILKASFEYRDEVTITFSALPNPADSKQPLTIEAEDGNAAVTLAGTILGAMGIKTHSNLGDLASSYYPDYFIGEVNDGTWSDPWTKYRITKFFPLERK